MAIKKSELYSSLWASCNELRGGMDASQYKDYVLTMLFVKYVSDKNAGDPMSLIEVPKGASFEDMVALKGQKDIGDCINKEILKPLFAANDLEGSMELADFNDDDKLGSDQEKVDRLTKLIAIFENPALNFKNNRAEDDDILGDAYEYLMRHFATQSGKSKGQFYTPAEVSRILSRVIDADKADKLSFTAYDPTCGSGSLLMKVAEESQNGLTIYGQEKDIATRGLAIMNMWLHGYPEAEIAGKNTIAYPQFKEDDSSLKRFDFVVANPPFSVKNWTSGIVPMDDEFNRFAEYGVPPEKNGDYAFLLHILASLKSTGKGAIILPHGVLFRGNAEAKIRQNIIERKWIKGIIGLPANLFYGTGIPACIIVIDKENAEDRKGIFMIDASKGFIKDGNKNRLREQDMHKIVDVFNHQKEVEKYARFVPFEEIEKNEYNLNIPRYIDTQEEEDIQDLDAHLNGGIPTKDIDGLQGFWKVYPTLRKELFSSLREGYAQLNVEPSAIKETIYKHPEFDTYSVNMGKAFENWKNEIYEDLQGIDINTAPKKFIKHISTALLNQYEGKALISQYDIYQYLMNYWNETMKDDTYLIIEEGWKATVKINEKKDKKGNTKVDSWTTDLIPKELVVNKYLLSDKAELNDLENELESKESEIQEMIENNGGEEQVLNEVTKIGEAKESFVEYSEAAYNHYYPKEYKEIQSLLETIDKKSKALINLEEISYFSSLKNARGQVTQTNVKRSLKTLNEDSEEAKTLNQWIDRTKRIAQTRKKLGKITKTLDQKLMEKIQNNVQEEHIVDLKIIHDFIGLHEEVSALKKDIKAKEKELDVMTLEQFQKLTEAEVRTLVVDDKWLTAIQSDIQAEIDGISQRLTARVKELAERYKNKLGTLATKTEELEAKVATHLEKMGLVWG